MDRKYGKEQLTRKHYLIASALLSFLMFACFLLYETQQDEKKLPVHEKAYRVSAAKITQGSHFSNSSGQVNEVSTVGMNTLSTR